jgi:hypothetical protein
MHTTIQIQRRATLDGFAADVSDVRGVNLSDLEPLTVLRVRTRNSLYRIVVSDASKVLVQGGDFFPDSTAGHLSGSGFGGSLLKVGWIGVGLRMEFLSGDRRIVTSRVSEIAYERVPFPSRPH